MTGAVLRFVVGTATLVDQIRLEADERTDREARVVVRRQGWRDAAPRRPRRSRSGRPVDDRTFIRGDFNPIGIAVPGGYIYWSNPDSGTIGRAKLDGTRVDQSFIAGGSMPMGVTVGP